MADGKRSGLASGTSGAPQISLENGELQATSAENENVIANNISFPTNDAQIKHMFRNAPGHLNDTAENRKIILQLANDNSKIIGTDRYGNSWNSEILSDGSQNWVRYRNGTINNCGKSIPPRTWDDEVGFNKNPKNNNTWRKKK